MARSIKKKPCPYCEKRLCAPSKTRWRCNLARHLQNCLPYQRETIGMMTRGILAILEHYFPVSVGAGDYVRTQNAIAEVAELERLHKLDGE